MKDFRALKQTVNRLHKELVWYVDESVPYITNNKLEITALRLMHRAAADTLIIKDTGRVVWAIRYKSK